MEKQPLINEPSAPPPPYSYATAPAYPPPQAVPPNYGPPPPQAPPFQAANVTNVTVIQARPISSRPVLTSKPPNFIIMSVVVLILFCWIFGLIALLYGLQVDSLWTSGDHIGALSMSYRARRLNVAGIIIGVIFYVLIIASAAANTV